MADGQGNGDAAQTDIAPSINAMVQYTKDFSFENPNAPRSLGPQEKAPNIAIQVNVNARQVAEADFEVNILLEGLSAPAFCFLSRAKLSPTPCARVAFRRFTSIRSISPRFTASVSVRPPPRCRLQQVELFRIERKWTLSAGKGISESGLVQAGAEGGFAAPARHRRVAGGLMKIRSLTATILSPLD
jgi:hypothetical protein